MTNKKDKARYRQLNERTVPKGTELDKRGIRQVFTCGYKRQYPTKKRARLGAIRLEKITGAKQRPYRCEICGMWHLTTHDKRGERQ